MVGCLNPSLAALQIIQSEARPCRECLAYLIVVRDARHTPNLAHVRQRFYAMMGMKSGV